MMYEMIDKMQVKIPKVPDYVNVNGVLTPIGALSEMGLRKLNAAWLKVLIANANQQRKRLRSSEDSSPTA